MRVVARLDRVQQHLLVLQQRSRVTLKVLELPGLVLLQVLHGLPSHGLEPGVLEVAQLREVGVVVDLVLLH